MAIVRGAIFLGANCPGAIFRGAISQGAIAQGTIVLEPNLNKRSLEPSRNHYLSNFIMSITKLHYEEY